MSDITISTSRPRLRNIVYQIRAHIRHKAWTSSWRHGSQTFRTTYIYIYLYLIIFICRLFQYRYICFFHDLWLVFWRWLPWCHFTTDHVWETFFFQCGFGVLPGMWCLCLSRSIWSIHLRTKVVQKKHWMFKARDKMLRFCWVLFCCDLLQKFTSRKRIRRCKWAVAATLVEHSFLVLHGRIENKLSESTIGITSLKNHWSHFFIFFLWGFFGWSRGLRTQTLTHTQVILQESSSLW